MSKIVAGSRLIERRVRGLGCGAYIHRWLGDLFVHNNEHPERCICSPIYVAADDRRSVEEVIDDVDDGTDPAGWVTKQ